MVDLKKIKAIREKLGLTQGQAAKRAGLRSRQHWNKIEVGGDGGITVATLEKVARALRVKARDLLK
jgi:transcriptional regulator with XRE-family HTH domain